MLQMPKSALKIFELTTSEDTEIDDLVAAIQIDPTFTARLLQSVNSAAFSRGVEVTSIRGAVSRIGRERLAQLAAVMATVSEVKKLECKLLKTAGYWRHSLTAAITARELAIRFEIDADACFLGGLLHDLGKPVEFHLLGDRMLKVLDKTLLDDLIDISVAEEDELGFSHSEIGAQIAERWNLPSLVVESIRFHHHPERAESHPNEVAIVALANAMEAIEVDEDYEDFDHFELICERVDARFRLERSEALEIVSLARAEAKKIMQS